MIETDVVFFNAIENGFAMLGRMDIDSEELFFADFKQAAIAGGEPLIRSAMPALAFDLEPQTFLDLPDEARVGLA